MRILRTLVALTSLGMGLLWLGCGPETVVSTDLGDFASTGKADAFSKEFSFEVGPASGSDAGRVDFKFRTLSYLNVKVQQAGTKESLQLEVVGPEFNRQTTHSASPSIDVPGKGDTKTFTLYEIHLLNWGSNAVKGVLKVESEMPSQELSVIFNTPDCQNSCEDKSNGLRGAVVQAIQSAQNTIDFAIYGFDDPEIKEALCNVAKAGVQVRVVTDDSQSEGEGRYAELLTDPEKGLVACGVPIVIIHSSGIMHNKFYIIDREGDNPILITGSTNQTVADFDVNHNHLVFIKGVRELMDVFQKEFDQLFRNCATERLDGKTKCTQCTPACVENVTAEGPYTIGNISVEAYFSPRDDALEALRGLMTEKRMGTPDPACSQPDADCACIKSGASWVCDYCGQGANGWGLLGNVQNRFYIDIYSGTDTCLALAQAKAFKRGVRTMGIWDLVSASSPYSRDKYLCGEGVPALITNWGKSRPTIRNHHKTVVIDDIVFDGSMNLSNSGSDKNNENTLVYHDAQLANDFEKFIQSEWELLQVLGAKQIDAAECRCKDLLDNDGDGKVDKDDPDCDSGTQP
jgi:phosphatidylserine/phosphatidylglycerophosphate/cardiolipin synthase-like enzyme